MIRVVRFSLLLLLTLTTWKVYAVRAQLTRDDADPGTIAALRERLDALPLKVADGAYRGEPSPVDAEIVEQSGADSYASIRYTDGQGHAFRLYVGGSIRNQENFHAPSYCMPASGWELLEESVVPFSAYPVETKRPHMRRLLLQYGSQRMVVYYWFQAGSRLADHEWTVRYFRFLDLLADEPFRPTLIITLYVPVKDAIQETEEAAAEFLRTVGPLLHSAIQTKE